MNNLIAYSFIRTNQHGAVQNCYVTIDGQNFTWSFKTFTVIFNNFESKDEADRGTMPRQPFEMTLKDNAFLSQAMAQIPEAERELPFLIVFSNRIWQMALETKFIPDYSEIDENNKRVMVLKSLTDLNATLHEIPLS